MWKKIAIAGATGAVIIGAGTAALAASGTIDGSSSPSSSPSGSGTSSAPSGPSASGEATAGTAAKAGGHKVARRVLWRARNFEHGSWVTGNAKDATTVDHTAIRGDVTAVSATSISVKAKDGTAGTFVVNSATKVHTRAEKKGAAISDIKTGDEVIVAGTGSPTHTATQVVDITK